MPASSTSLTTTRSGAPLAVPRLASATVTRTAPSTLATGVKLASLTAMRGAAAASIMGSRTRSGVKRSSAATPRPASMTPASSVDRMNRFQRRRGRAAGRSVPVLAIMSLRASRRATSSGSIRNAQCGHSISTASSMVSGCSENRPPQPPHNPMRVFGCGRVGRDPRSPSAR